MPSKDQAIRAYQRIHEVTLEKRAMSRDSKKDQALVKEYLETSPEGFTVALTDARERTYEYLVQLEDASRAVLDKGLLANKLDVDKSEITPGLLAEAVETGKLRASQIQDLEDVTYHKKVKRTKVKRPLKKDERV